jgi:hypothetical protein
MNKSSEPGIPQNPYTFGLIVSEANDWEQQAVDNMAASDIWDGCSREWAKYIIGQHNGTTYDETAVDRQYAIIAIPMEEFLVIKNWLNPVH